MKKNMGQKKSKLPPNYTFIPLHHGVMMGESEIHGNGLFAGEELSNNFVIGPSHVNIYCTEMIHHPGQMEYLEHYHPGGMIRTSLGGWVNHSEDGNLELIDKGCFSVFATNRVVEAGEELTIDYAKALCGII